MNIVNQFFKTLSDFEAYVSKLQFNGWTPSFVVVHNTSSPNQALYKNWHDRKDWTVQQWGKNLASYYAGMGWNGCPHCFVGYDGILVLNPLTIHGTHTPSWNKISWGIETIAEFENEPFNNGVKENLIGCLGILHSRVGLNPADFKLGVRGLHLHKEDKGTTHKDCPGKHIIKQDLVDDVVAYMNKDDPPDHHVAISEAVQTLNTSTLSEYELIDIKWLQSNLNAKENAGLKVDGKLGENTKEAVETFQKKYNLRVDGIAGPATRKKLKELSR